MEKTGPAKIVKTGPAKIVFAGKNRFLPEYIFLILLLH